MQLVTGRDTAKRKQIVEDSKIFDARDYLTLNPDVAIAVNAGKTDALSHFVQFGWSENRSFSRFFDAQTYLAKHADIAAAVAIEETSVNEHFFRFGFKEKRQVNALFDFDYYLNAQTDVAEAVEAGNTTALQHFFQFGIDEARSFTSYFGAILNRESFQSLFQTEIGASFDVQTADQLTDEQVVDLVTSLGDRAIDVDYYRDRHGVSLQEFFGLPAIELSNDQIRAFAFNQGAEIGLARTSVNLSAYAATYSAQLIEFYGVTTIEEVTESEIESFAIGDGLTLGLDVTAFLDTAYYRSQYGAAIAASFGAEFTDRQLVGFIFGDDAPYIDTDYYQQLFGQNITAAGELVANLSTDDLRRYALTEGFNVDTPLSPFDLEACRSQNAEALAQFYGVAEVASLSQTQIRDFLVSDAWAFGISIANFTDAAAVELFRSQNRDALAQRYQVAIDSVSELSAEIVLDFQFGGASSAIDFDYVRSTFSGDALAVFGTTSVTQATDAQILDYVYSQANTLTSTDLAPIDARGYRSRYTSEIATALNLSTSEVLKLDRREIESFIFGEGASLGLDLTEFANLEYFRSTYRVAIAQSFGIEISAVNQLSASDISGWYVNESRDLSIDFLRHQIESLSVGQQAQLFASVGLAFDATAFITTEQVTTLAYSSAFSALFQTEDLQLSVIDIDAYVETNVEVLYKFYFGSEVILSEQTRSTKRTAGGFKISTKKTKKSTKKDTNKGTKGTKKTRTTLKNIAATLKKLKTKKGKDTVKNTKKPKKTGDVTVVDGVASVDETTTVTIETNVTIEAKLEAVRQLSREQVVSFMFGRGTKLGIETTDVIEVDFLRHAFASELLATYDVSTTKEIDDRLVIDLVYGGLSSEIDFAFYRNAHAAELTATYGLAIEQITDTLILEHAYEFGVDQGLALASFDQDAILLAQTAADPTTNPATNPATDPATGSGVDEVPDEATVDSFSLRDFVDVNFLRESFEADLLTEYRVQNVYNVGKAKTVGFFEGRGRTFGGLNLSAAIDFEFYRSTYAAQISANTTTIDSDQNGTIDDLELFDYITDAGLEQGLNPSKLVDFAAYRADGSASTQALLNYYSKTNIQDITYRETLEFMFGAGLEQGFAPSSAIDLAAIRTQQASSLVAFYQVSSIEHVSLTQTFNYAFGAGFDEIGAAIAT
jgi:hypothetical protein